MKPLFFILLAALLLSIGCDDANGTECTSVSTEFESSSNACRYEDEAVGLICDCDSSEALVCQVLELVNQEREKAGAPALTYQKDLAAAAQLHALEMVSCKYFDHGSLDGRNFSKRSKDAGYSGFPSGENIAAGSTTAEAVMNQWMNSSGHRANILNPNFKEIGIGFAEGDVQFGTRWVQKFGQ